jgi:hypothetical protein
VRRVKVRRSKDELVLKQTVAGRRGFYSTVKPMTLSSYKHEQGKRLEKQGDHQTWTVL